MVEEHKDLEGRVVLKKAKLGTEDVNTYYLYDDLGRLVCVIQPEGFKALANSPAPNQYKFSDIEAATQINADIRDRFMFQYRYDARNRLIRKFVPGAEPSTSADWKGWTFMVYDKRDRLILSQEPRQRLSNEWTATKYDALNRPVISVRSITTNTQGQLQNSANAATQLFEVRLEDNFNADVNYYTNLSFPTNLNGTLSVYYYDSYDINNDNNYTNDIDVNLDASLNDIPYPLSPNDLIDPANSPYSKQVVNANTLYVNRGKLVMTKQRRMLTNTTTGAVIFASNTSGTNPPSYIITVNFYDKYGRLVQSQMDNIKKNASNITLANRNKEITTIRYDFSGKVLETRLRHRATGTTTQTSIVNKQMEYDHAGRLKRLYNQIDGQAKVLMAQNEYNEIGQLVKKNIHSLDEGGTFMQNVDYTYNIRGWLTFINKNPATNNISIATNAQSLFRMELRYLNNYNGNISTMLWRGNKNEGAGKYNGNVVRQYAFTYDGLNRLTKANYTVTGGFAGENYSVNNGTAANGISYDYNGNILNLQQNGPTAFDANQVPTAFGVIDNLTYAYSGNRLMRVTDAGDNTANTPATQRGDFKDGTNSGDDYTYDNSGNLTSDLNKGISLITYNHLNLPMLIRKDANNFMHFVYDGSGAKLRKTVVEAGTTTTTEYIGSFVYTKVGAAPEDYFMATEEGRIVNLAGKPFGSPETYEYTYKDHLGNARLSYRQTPITPIAPITLTYETPPGQATEEANFPNAWSVRVQGEGYRSNHSGKLPTGTMTQAGSKKITASAGQSLRVSVRATYNTDPVQVQYMIVQNGGTIEDQDKREKPVLPPNRLTLNSPVVVIPAQPQQNIGEVIIPASPPRLNLIGIAQVLGKTLSLQRKAKEDPATPYQGDLGQMNLLGMQSTPPASTAKLVLEVYNGNSLLSTQEQYVSTAGETAWEELSIGMTLPPNTTSIVAYMKHEGGTDVFFDDLKIELNAVPVAVVVQENHYYPFGMGMKGLDYTAPSPNTENKFTFNGKEKQTELSLNWHDYGARNYDPQILRFTSVDRFAEKYYNFSSYQYAANNPIKYIDVNGDSIQISHGGQNYLYLNGKLYSRQADGSRKLYIAQNGSFLSKTLTALNLIGSGGKAGQELIKYFENGSLGKDIRIEQGQDNGERSGIISFNPDNELKNIPNQNGSFGRPSFIGLAHEIGHTWDRHENGITNTNSIWYQIDANNTAFNSEKIATWWENKIRAENNISLREFYSFSADINGKTIGDPRGRLLIEGTRVSMWNFNKISIQSNPIQINEKIKIPSQQFATGNLPYSY
jgi:RHS repeat-associated protein